MGKHAAYEADVQATTSDPGHRDLRRALGAFATGVTVVTTCLEDGTPAGITVNSFSSVSLEPPLILWSLDRGSRCRPHFSRARSFAVNILAQDQIDVAMHFASSKRDRFDQIKWTIGALGAPLLDGAVASLECRKISEMEGGDHIVLLGEVIKFRRSDKRPLLFCVGKFMSLGGIVCNNH